METTSTLPISRINYTFLAHVLVEVLLFSATVFITYRKMNSMSERIELLEEKINELEQKLTNPKQQTLLFEQKMSEIFEFYKNELTKNGTEIIRTIDSKRSTSVPSPCHLTVEDDSSLDKMLNEELDELK